MNVSWLRRFARNLARKLGLELGGIEAVGEADSEDRSQTDLDFLYALIAAEQEDSSQVQQLFARNIQRLTPSLGATMKWLMTQVLEQLQQYLPVTSGAAES